MDIGSRLRSERERLGYSQADFGTIAGASEDAQNEWERGVAEPDANALSAWAQIGIDVLYVVTGQPSFDLQPALSPEDRALIDDYNNASPWDQAAIRHILKYGRWPDATNEEFFEPPASTDV